MLERDISSRVYVILYVLVYFESCIAVFVVFQGHVRNFRRAARKVGKPSASESASASVADKHAVGIVLFDRLGGGSSANSVPMAFKHLLVLLFVNVRLRVLPCRACRCAHDHIMRAVVISDETN